MSSRVESREPDNTYIRHHTHTYTQSGYVLSHDSDQEIEKILKAEPVPELPDKAEIKWPKKRKIRIRRDRTARTYRAVPLRDAQHIQAATEAGLDRQRCTLCGVTKTYGHFDVHHLNGDPNDNRPENLIVLCRNCHIAVQHGYTPDIAPSDMDGVHAEDEGVLEEG